MGSYHVSTIPIGFCLFSHNGFGSHTVCMYVVFPGLTAPNEGSVNGSRPPHIRRLNRRIDGGEKKLVFLYMGELISTSLRRTFTGKKLFTIYTSSTEMGSCSSLLEN